MAKITQTAGRNTLGTFAPEFAHFNDDVLFGENWNNEDIDLKTRSIITVVARPARPTKISTKPMKTPVGAMPTSTRFFVLKRPIMPSSTKRAFITTTVELMWSLMTQTI